MRYVGPPVEPPPPAAPSRGPAASRIASPAAPVTDATAALGAVLLAYFLVRLPYLDFVPLWDGVVYHHFARNSLDHVIRNLDIFAAEVHDHISFVYMVLLGVPGKIAPDQIFLFNSWLLALSAATVVVFHRLLSHFGTARAGAVERGLMSAVFAFHPVILANSVNPSLESGLLLFFLLFLLALLRQRYWGAAVAGTCLLFTKETGLLLFPVALLSVVLAHPEPRDAKWLRSMAPVLWVPIACFVAYALVKTQVRGLPLFWTGMRHWEGLDTAGLILRAINVFHYDDRLRAALLFGWVLNFQWVSTLLLLALAALAHLRRALIPPPDRRHTLLLALLALGTFYALTRFYPHDNARYLLPFYGVVLLLLFQLLAVATVTARTRIALLGMLLGLSLLALYRSVDPVTAWQFGTFRFGSHDMYRMASVARGCCGHGRDQLVYNLQFVHFHYLQNRLFPRIAPGPDTVIAQNWDTAWAIHVQLDAATFRRTLSTRHAFMPSYTSASELPGKFPDADLVYYVEYPNTVNGREKADLMKRYPHAEPFTVAARGYALRYWRLSNAPAGAPKRAAPAASRTEWSAAAPSTP